MAIVIMNQIDNNNNNNNNSNNFLNFLNMFSEIIKTSETHKNLGMSKGHSTSKIKKKIAKIQYTNSLKEIKFFFFFQFFLQTLEFKTSNQDYGNQDWKLCLEFKCLLETKGNSYQLNNLVQSNVVYHNNNNNNNNKSLWT